MNIEEIKADMRFNINHTRNLIYAPGIDPNQLLSNVLANQILIMEAIVKILPDENLPRP